MRGQAGQSPLVGMHGLERRMRTTWRRRNGTRATALGFPNRSRAWDATRRAVRFWGNDRALEVSFFVTEDALRRIAPGMPGDEAEKNLAAFDAHRDLIHATAAKIYARGRKGSYDLNEADF
jgi:hypothetical protein